MNPSQSKVAVSYIRSRKISAAMAYNFKMGFATKIGGGLYQNLTNEGFTPQELLNAGLILQSTRVEKSVSYYDRFRNRLMIPICTVNGDVIGFGGRCIEDSSITTNVNTSPTAKYINSPETAVFKKHTTLFGLNLARKSIIDSGCVMVEGYFDVMALHEMGIEYAVGMEVEHKLFHYMIRTVLLQVSIMGLYI
jgi:DNA primase